MEGSGDGRLIGGERRIDSVCEDGEGVEEGVEVGLEVGMEAGIEVDGSEEVAGAREEAQEELPEGALQLEDFQKGEEELSPAWQERARQELGEESGVLESGLISLEASLPSPWPLPRDKSFLTRFLRARGHQLPGALDMLARYLAARRDRPHYFSSCSPSLAAPALGTGLVTVLPHRDRRARRVLVFRVENWRPGEVSREEVFSAVTLLLELLVREPHTQVSGISALVDMAGLSWSHWSQLSLEYIRSMVAVLQGAFPIRFREIHVVNESAIFGAAYSLVSPFLTDKIRGRLQLHGREREALHRSLGEAILPREYGGSQDTVCEDQVKAALVDMESYCHLLQTSTSPISTSPTFASPTPTSPITTSPTSTAPTFTAPTSTPPTSTPPTSTLPTS